MPNLVPIKYAAPNILRGYLGGLVPLKVAVTDSAHRYVATVRESHLREDRAFVNPLEGFKPWRWETTDDDGNVTVHYERPDRPGSRFTRPNADDTSVRLAQYVAASGYRGVAVLARTVTANGRGTRTPIDPRGLCPTERLNWQPTAEDDTLSDSEMRQLRRYRNAMKGDKFAASMQREAVARSRNYWRAAYPYWPLNADGSFESGKRRVNPNTGRDTLRFKDGSYLDDRINAHADMHADEMEAINAKRKRVQSELDRLIAEQQDDMRDTRKHSKRVRKV